MSKGGGKRWLGLAIAGLVLLAVGVLGAWALRGVVATSLARAALEERGFRCDERFAVSVSARFGSATVGPTRCAREGEGHLEALELLGPARVSLSGLRPTSVEVESLRIVLSERDVPRGSGWAPELARLNLEQRVAGLMKALGELARLRLPPTTVVRADLQRGGSTMAQAERLVLTGRGESAELQLSRLTFEALMGAARLTLSDVTGTATAASVRLRGEATARAGIALLGTFSTGGRFDLEASALDGAEPRLRLRASF